jgi:hypothetical protein
MLEVSLCRNTGHAIKVEEGELMRGEQIENLALR